MWEIDFTPTDRPVSYQQVTLDVVLRPSAELSVGVGVDLTLLGRERELFSGRLGVGVALPVRLYWTSGNACSDANGNGVNEDVHGLLIDAKVQLYVFVEGRVLGDISREYLNVNLPGDFIPKVINDFLDRDDRVPVWEKHLLLEVIEQGTNSPLQPTINQAGLFTAGGKQVEGVELGPVRSCYPFNDQVLVELDFGGTKIFVEPSNVTPRFVRYNWPDDGANQTVRARITTDELGREINGPWVVVDISDNQDHTGSLETPAVELGVGLDGPEIRWQDNGVAQGFNIYVDGQYVDTVGDGVRSWPFDFDEDQAHEYAVVAFDGNGNFTPLSNRVRAGGPIDFASIIREALEGVVG